MSEGCGGHGVILLSKHHRELQRIQEAFSIKLMELKMKMSCPNG